MSEELSYRKEIILWLRFTMVYLQEKKRHSGKSQEIKCRKEAGRLHVRWCLLITWMRKSALLFYFNCCFYWLFCHFNVVMSGKRQINGKFDREKQQKTSSNHCNVLYVSLYCFPFAYLTHGFNTLKSNVIKKRYWSNSTTYRTVWSASISGF